MAQSGLGVRARVQLVLLSLLVVAALGLPLGAGAAAPPARAGIWDYKYGNRTPTASGAAPTAASGAVAAASLTPSSVPESQPNGWPRAGEYGMYSFWSQKLSDRMVLKVNLENGNLLFEQNDLGLPGVAGLGVDFARVYNSNQNYATDTYGLAWNATLGSTVGLNDFTDHVDYFTAGGDYATFTRTVQNAQGGWMYTSPPGVDATLVHNADGTYVLTWRSGIVDDFGSTGLWLDRKDRHGNKISFTYQYLASYHQTATIVDSYGRTITFTVDPATGMTTKMVDGSGRTWQYSYSSGSQPNLTSYIDPNNKTTTYHYTNGLMDQITDPNGQVTTIAYANNGTADRVTSVTRKDPGHTDKTWTFTYDDTARTTKLTDPNGHYRTYYQDTNNTGEITKTIDQLGRQVQAGYTPAGNPGSATNEAGGVTSYTNSAASANGDVLEKLTQVKGPATPGGQRATSSYTYGGTGANQYLPTAVQNENGSSWQYSYDANGNLTSKGEGSGAAPGQNAVVFTYNSDGTIATATDARGNQWRYCYDPGGSCTGATTHNLTTITPPSGSTVAATSATYDSLNRLSCVTDGKGNKTCYAYDNLDRVTTITTFDSAGTTFDVVTYVYDNDGNLTSQHDASGTINFSYDALNRMTQETHPGPTSTSYGYDGEGNLTSLVDGSGTTTYEYDAADRLVRIHEPTAPSGAGYITYSYPDETHTTIGYPNGASVASTYDNAGRLTALTDKDGMNAIVAAYTYSYAYTAGGAAADGSLRRSVTNNGVTTYYCYDPLGRLASAGSGSSCPTSGPSWGDPAAAYQYTYDVTGNMTSKIVNGTATYYSYKPANELCYMGTTQGGACGSSFGFDANGNQTAGPGSGVNGWSFAYNPKDQTTSTNQFAGTTYAGQSQTVRTKFDDWSFTNDQLGLASRTSPSSGTLSYFTRDPSGRVLGIRENYNNQGYGKTYLLFDGLGSVIAKTNSSGVVTGSYSYDPYGNTISSADTQGSTLNPFHYAGMYQDSTGLYKAGMRYYDPSIARWTQRDSINQPLDEHGWNPYDYAGDDPINMIDPSGTCICILKRAKDLAVALWDTHDSAIALGGGIGIIFGCTVGAGAAAPETAGGSLALMAVCLPPALVAGAVAGYEFRHAVHHYGKVFSRNG